MISRNTNTPFRTLVRAYSGPNFVLLVPENEKFLFDFEKLSPQEISASIPKKPTIPENTRKHYYSIPDPKSIADLILQPDFHDIFITSLATKKPFSGDESLKLISKPQSTTVQQPEATAYLRFENKTFHWIQEFNKHNFSLKSLEEVEEDGQIAFIAHHNKVIQEKIASTVAAATGATDVKLIYEALDVFRNHEKKLSDSLHQSELTAMVTFDHLLLHLLRNAVLQQDGLVDFVELLTFIESNLTFCSYENGILPMLELLIPHLHSHNEDSLNRDTFDRFYEKVTMLFPKVKSDLLLTNLDKLAYISLESFNIRRAQRIIKTLLRRQKVAISNETYQSLLQFYIYDSNELSKEVKRTSILQFMSDYKPLLFHYGIDERSFLLITPTISTYFELDHLVKFIESSNPDLLGTKQTELYQILRAIQTKVKELVLVANLQAAQLTRRLVIDNEVELTDTTRELLKEKYQLNETCT